MQRKLLANVALCSTIAQAISTKLLMKSLQQSNTSHTCIASHDRVKSGRTDFYTLVNDNGTGHTDFTDTTFPTDDAIYWADDGTDQTNSEFAQFWRANQHDFFWERVNTHSFFTGQSATLFGSQGIRPEDINQGRIGNCWFKASLTALAEYTGRVESLFLNKEISQAGVYAINMYALNVPVTITIDDMIPMQSWSNSSGRNTWFSEVGDDGSVWGPLIEKAFSKFHGNYGRIEGGDLTDGVTAMNGGPSKHVNCTTFSNYNSSQKEYTTKTATKTPDEIWADLSQYDTEDMKGMMIGGTFYHPFGDTVRNSQGIVFNHAYTILSAVQLADGTRLVKLRNPWDSDRYTGPYGDSNMTQAVATELGHTLNEEDGFFYMDINDFYKHFSDYGLTYNVEGWHHAWHLVLDDDGSDGGSPGQWSNWCGNNCTRYTAKVKNDFNGENKIHVGLHTWRARGYGTRSECTGSSGDYHSIYWQGQTGNVLIYENGEHWLDPFTVNANSYAPTFTIELDLSRNHQPKDWSLTAWGENGPVSIEIVGKSSPSDSFPFVPRVDASLPENEGRPQNNDDNDDNGGGGDDNDNGGGGDDNDNGGDGDDNDNGGDGGDNDNGGDGGDNGNDNDNSQPTAIDSYVTSLKGYADAAEAAKGQAKTESDASDALLTSAQSSKGDSSALLNLLNQAKSNRDDATTNFGTAEAQNNLATSLAKGDLATTFATQMNQQSATISSAINQQVDIEGNFASVPGQINEAKAARDGAQGYKENAQSVVDQIQALYDLNSWLDNQTITKSGCGTSAAHLNLEQVDGVLRMYLGSNCGDDVEHVYFTWRWALDAWDKIKDTVTVSAGYKNIPYVSGNPARAADTIEIDCWTSGSYQKCKSVMPAGGSKKVGLEFKSDDLSYADMVSAFESYKFYFFS